jgi:hypothetical protein
VGKRGGQVFILDRILWRVKNEDLTLMSFPGDFIDMSSIAVLGILLGFIIPKGKGHLSNNYFLGLHRHE